MQRFAALLLKDLRLELRGKEALTIMLVLGIMLALIAAFGIRSAGLSPQMERRLYPAFIWIIMLFTATVCHGRTHDLESRDGAFESVLLCNVSPSLLFLSKVINIACTTLISFGASALLLAILIDLDLTRETPSLIVIVVLVVTAYSALSSLLAPLAAGGRLRNILFPLITIPLLFPLLFAAVELSALLLEDGLLHTESPWFALLVLLNVVYLLLGIGLYERAVLE